jgi:hypothetical protein
MNLNLKSEVGWFGDRLQFCLRLTDAGAVG